MGPKAPLLDTTQETAMPNDGSTRQNASGIFETPPSTPQNTAFVGARSPIPSRVSLIDQLATQGSVPPISPPITPVKSSGNDADFQSKPHPRKLDLSRHKTASQLLSAFATPRIMAPNVLEPSNRILDEEEQKVEWCQPKSEREVDELSDVSRSLWGASATGTKTVTGDGKAKQYAALPSPDPTSSPIATSPSRYPRRQLRETPLDTVKQQAPRTSRRKSSSSEKLVDAQSTNRQSARERFLLKNSERILPLLPAHNFLKSLAQKNFHDESREQDILTIAFEIVRQPQGIIGELRPHQLEGLSFLVYLYRNGASAILADEMGLGKTLQAVAFLQHLKEAGHTALSSNRSSNYLVVCPLTVLNTWQKEIRRWAPTLSVFQLYGSSEERGALKMTFRTQSDIDIVLTTYDTIRAERSWFLFRHWRCVILDEGHVIKDHTSKIAKGLVNIRTDQRVILTGTPLQNDLGELWSLLHWLYKDIFDAKSEQLFTDAFNISHGKADSKFFKEVSQFLEVIMLQRTKDKMGLETEMPAKKEVLLHVPLTPTQRMCYEMLLGTVETNFWGVDDAAVLDQYSQRALRNLIVELRKCCNHPDLVLGTESDGDQLVEVSGKLIVLRKLVEELVLKSKKKVLVFSGFTSMLDICERFLSSYANQEDGFQVLRLDGSTCPARRNLVQYLLNNPVSPHRVMLISTRAGGLGINLVGASEVVMMDSDWNPQVTLQAEARAHRIGQRQDVTVFKLACQGSVEEQMLGRIEKKAYMATAITSSMRTVHSDLDPGSPNTESPSSPDVPNMPQLDHGELVALVRSSRTALAYSKVDVEEMAGWDFQTVLEKCGAKRPEPSAILTQPAVHEDEDWLRQVEHIKTRLFEGRTYSKHKPSSRTSRQPSEADKVGDRASRRQGKERFIMINEWLVRKDSLAADAHAEECKAQTKSKGKDANIRHQTRCQLCHQPDADYKCSMCPRAYHRECADQSSVKRGKSGLYACSQHRCRRCERPAQNAGGMLYRCQSCADAYCEACIDLPQVTLIGETISEFEELGWKPASSAYFIKCIECVEKKDVRVQKRKRDEAEGANVGSKKGRSDGNVRVDESNVYDELSDDTIHVAV